MKPKLNLPPKLKAKIKGSAIAYAKRLHQKRIDLYISNPTDRFKEITGYEYQKIYSIRVRVLNSMISKNDLRRPEALGALEAEWQMANPGAVL